MASLEKGPTKAERQAVANPKLEGNRVILRKLSLSDVSEDYVNWMNDPEVVKYTESRFRSYTSDDLKSYVRKIDEENTSIFLAIILKENGKHIGNIKIGPINWIHRFADVGLIIGRRNSWGKGYATEAIRLVVDYSFTQLHLHKLTAGAYINNIGSVKAFKRAGFVEEGMRRSHFLFSNKYVDEVCLAVINQI